jgi:hypothetical protein
MSPTAVQAAAVCSGVDVAADDACVPLLDVADGDAALHAPAAKTIPATTSVAGNR